MKVLAFDGRAGASGDMILAALVAAGADRTVLEPIEEALDLEYRVGETTTCGIAATTVDVLRSSDAASTDSDGEKTDVQSARDRKFTGLTHGDAHGHGDDDAHGHEADVARGHGTSDAHGHRSDATHHSDSEGDHDHDTDAVHAEGHGPHRSYREVCSIVESMGLDPAVERDALAIFEILGEAEATVHGASLDAIHFHEVGADDAIADVVGAVALLAELEPERVVTTPVSAGGGTVSMSHGEYPIPGPAVAEIATGADWSLRGGPVDRELLTPTGAAILAHVAEGVDAIPNQTVESVGYGAGSMALDPIPNVLRAVVGETGGRLVREEISVLETNVDDVTPEVLGSLQASLGDVGARDVAVLPATMKKSRPGHLVKVVCRPADRERVARRLAEETGTLGVRDAGVTHRWIANRAVEPVEISIDGEPYELGVKIATDTDGVVLDVSAEYDDARAIAHETELTVREVSRRAEAMAHRRSETDRK